VKVVTKEETTDSAVSPDESKSTASVRTTKHCINCSAEIDINAAMCPKCGVMQNKKPMGKSKMFCRNCGAEIDINAEICPKCGVRQKSGGIKSAISETSISTTGGKSPLVAALLSFLIIGVGQVYAGKTLRGIVLFGAAVLCTIIGSMVMLPFLILFAIWVVGIYDAYKLAEGDPGPLAFIDQYTHEV
jgi:TM2 domain-containing membrane protein YozV/ribosomal protein L40E